MRSLPLFSLSVLSCALVLSGCASPKTQVVGDWKESPSLGVNRVSFDPQHPTRPAELSLKASGNGYLKAESLPELALTWKVDDDRVLISGLPGELVTSGASAVSPSPYVVGKLSADRKTLTLDMGVVQMVMLKQ